MGEKSTWGQQQEEEEEEDLNTSPIGYDQMEPTYGEMEGGRLVAVEAGPPKSLARDVRLEP